MAWAALLGASVAGMAIVMQVTADPAATTANTTANIIAFSTFAAIGLALAGIVYQPSLRRGDAGSARHRLEASRGAVLEGPAFS